MVYSVSRAEHHLEGKPLLSNHLAHTDQLVCLWEVVLTVGWCGKAQPTVNSIIPGPEVYQKAG